jgi:hypothetical protein
LIKIKLLVEFLCLYLLKILIRCSLNVHQKSLFLGEALQQIETHFGGFFLLNVTPSACSAGHPEKYPCLLSGRSRRPEKKLIITKAYGFTVTF